MRWALIALLAIASCGDDTTRGPPGPGGAGGHVGSGGAGGSGGGSGSGGAGGMNMADASPDSGQCLGIFESCTPGGIPCCSGLNCTPPGQCLMSFDAGP